MPATVQKISLPRRLNDAISAAARDAWPLECCGLLIGSGDEDISITEIVSAANVSETPGERFAIDPQVQFDTLRRFRDSDSRIVGHFHSHPNGEPRPSKHDIAMAYDPNAIWVVVAIPKQGQCTLAAYTIEQSSGAAGQVPIDLEE
ncbi:MAG: M67 family metallopeptidase [Rhodobacteraceae bacterium]|nr:M67 family metallopeptidase [Paracoccaceae bacterium]